MKSSNEAYFDILQRAKCELFLQVHEATCLAFANEDDVQPLNLASWRHLIKCHERLRSWYGSHQKFSLRMLP